MEYTYVSGMDEEAQHTCENCGFTGKVKEFVNGCPCCDAASNIDYADKELGSKHHYDLVLQSPVYRIVTGVVDYIISFLLCSLWIINTSRTFNGYDVSKIFIYSTILAMILYYFSTCAMLMRYWGQSDATKKNRTVGSRNSGPAPASIKSGSIIT